MSAGPSFSRRTGLKLPLAFGGALAGSTALSRPSLAQGTDARTLRFVPSANLSTLDPLWSAALIAFTYGYLVYDQLYGLDAQLMPQPQMVQGHELSDGEKTWRFTLREGLLFHDGEPVRAADCVASIRRWSQRDPFGQYLATQLDEMKAIDDRRFEIRLKRPYPLLTYGLGATACFIMPERVATKFDAFTQVTESVGSGPFRFVRDEWVSGARAVFTRFDKYKPRDEKPEFWSGGKVAHLDRVEWQIMPDPATAAAALQSGEVDWLERPLLDLVPQLNSTPGIKTEVVDRLGSLAMIYLNNREGPFSNPKLASALFPAVNQTEAMQAVLGDQKDLYKTDVGFFVPGSPYTSDAGMEVLKGKRDIAAAKKLLADAGYNGEKIVQIVSAESPTLNPLSEVTRAMFQELGVNVDYQATDWGTLLSRTRSRDVNNPWHCYAVTWSGLWVTNPGSSIPLYGEKPDPRMMALKDEWLQAPDLAAQKAVAARMQEQAFAAPPFIPLGQWFIPQAMRNNVQDVVKASTAVFWNVRKS
ncbi:ABC transporter substrate-binding protein [Roseomonas elaeocarpi]|uniref:ABC transporter substrate-binding protein n=1 Tax=Roseomonas elaeocarpi TaxID=907779 RepID=A0ABV6JPQ7_9PROT